MAEYWLLRLSQRVMESCCRGPLRAVLATHGLIDDADLVQRGLQVATRLLEIYASAKRPPRSWVGMLQLDAKRDMHRAVSDLDWLPRDLGEMVALAEAAGIHLERDPDVTLAALIDASLDAGRPLPRISAKQMRIALSRPELRSFDAPWGPAYGWQPTEGGLYAEDPALETVGTRPGWAAATIAALVTDDETTIMRASLGDPDALRLVADAVVSRLRRPGERPMATRRRCCSDFRTSGQLLSGDEAAASFAEADRQQLAALDAALRAAVDLDVPVGVR
jgi:hypothetical protein